MEKLTNQDAVDTGRLRNSITYATSKHTEAKSFRWNEGRHSGAPAGSGVTAPKGTPEKGTVCIGTNVEYAKYIEEGTGRSAARPFLKPAVTGHSEKYKRIAENILKNALSLPSSSNSKAATTMEQSTGGFNRQMRHNSDMSDVLRYGAILKFRTG